MRSRPGGAPEGLRGVGELSSSALPGRLEDVGAALPGALPPANPPPPCSMSWFKSFWKALTEPPVAAGMSSLEVAANFTFV